MARSKRKAASSIKRVTPARRGAYRKLRAKGMSVVKAAKIANKGRTFEGRSEMAKKAAKTRG